MNALNNNNNNDNDMNLFTHNYIFLGGRMLREHTSSLLIMR